MEPGHHQERPSVCGEGGSLPKLCQNNCSPYKPPSGPASIVKVVYRTILSFSLKHCRSSSLSSGTQRQKFGGGGERGRCSPNLGKRHHRKSSTACKEDESIRFSSGKHPMARGAVGTPSPPFESKLPGSNLHSGHLGANTDYVS